MLPREHIILGFIFSVVAAVLFKLNILSFIILFTCTWAFDIDHYLIYIINKKDWNLARAYRHMAKVRKMNEKRKLNFILKDNKLLLFHTIEFIVLFSIVLFFLSNWIVRGNLLLYLYLTGMGFHLFLDIFMEKTYKEKYCIILFIIAKHKKNKEKEM